MVVIERVYGTHIYPFLDSKDDERIAGAGYVYLPKKEYVTEDIRDAVQINIQFGEHGYISREKWAKLQAAVNKAFEIAEAV